MTSHGSTLWLMWRWSAERSRRASAEVSVSVGAACAPAGMPPDSCSSKRRQLSFSAVCQEQPTEVKGSHSSQRLVCPFPAATRAQKEGKPPRRVSRLKKALQHAL